jgi:hypothetical protein
LASRETGKVQRVDILRFTTDDLGIAIACVSESALFVEVDCFLKLEGRIECCHGLLSSNVDPTARARLVASRPSSV